MRREMVGIPRYSFDPGRDDILVCRSARPRLAHVISAVAQPRGGSMTKPTIAELKDMIGAEQDIDDIPVIVSWEKIHSEEPIWNVTIRGSNGRMTIKDARDITDHRRFVTQCFKQLNMI